MFSPFVVLLAAIGIEVGATTVLPRTRGFHDLTWSLVVLGGYALSIWLLAVVVRQMSVSVAYAVWSGLGTAAIAAVGAVAFGERLDAVKVTALALIITGVVVLNLHTAEAPADSRSSQSVPEVFSTSVGPGVSSSPSPRPAGPAEGSTATVSRGGRSGSSAIFCPLNVNSAVGPSPCTSTSTI